MAKNYLPKQAFYWKNGKLYGADFNTTFAGDPSNNNSYGCYAPCIVTAANKYFKAKGSSRKAKNITGTDFDKLLTTYINNNTPVLVWMTSSNLHASYLTDSWTTTAGKTVQWRAYEHCVVLTGYDKTKGLVYVSDPMVGNTSYSMSLFKQRYNELGKQCIYIAKS